MEKGEAVLHVKEESLPEKTVTKFRQAVALEHVSFSYEEGKKVLSDINIRFEKGKRYAVVGASGSGKSTLLGSCCWDMIEAMREEFFWMK